MRRLTLRLPETLFHRIASLGVVSDEEFDVILEEGELDENGTGLGSDMQARIEAKIAAARLN
ncbi:MAG: hypothetical protein KF770_17460 [Anaerolineae bacterium]|nr:hypothetical protein [Anaerolineae bacterium]